MNQVNSARESDEINDPFDGPQEGSYENYQMQNLPEGYNGYNGGRTRQVIETDYDRYDSDYEADETPQRDKKSCLEIGWLSNLLKSLSDS